MIKFQHCLIHKTIWLCLFFILSHVAVGQIHQDKEEVFLIVLGTVQDAGSPHIACKKLCCENLFDMPDPARKVTSLGLIDQKNSKKFLFEATPDMPAQMKVLYGYGEELANEVPDGIFLTHAHIGHYTGLMYLGLEAMNAKAVITYAMPRMKTFLEQQGPWSQLVSMNNIAVRSIKENETIILSDKMQVKPIVVPHRDEYSETVGYIIQGPVKSALFVPDIDKWEKWDLDIIQQIKEVDYAFLDATFFDGEEINNRDISEIPHPFVVESMQKFEVLNPEERNKVIFIHMNHTNPLLNPKSKASKTVIEKGFRIAKFMDIYKL